MTDTNHNGWALCLSHDPIPLTAAMKHAIALPQAICDDFAKRGQPATSRGQFPLQAPPLAQYINAQGYEFAWGHILERRVDNYIDWDFCLETVLAHYHKHNLWLADLQQAAFTALADSLPGLVGVEKEPAMSYPFGFKVYPGSVISAFTVRAHFAREAEARHWLSTLFLPLLLPGLLFQVQEAIG